MTSSPDQPKVRLAEVVASLSLATDLATGQALEHGLRRTLLAVWFGEELGVDPDELQTIYYVALLGTVGCALEAAAISPLVTDEIAIGQKILDVDPTRPMKMAAFFAGMAGQGEPPLRRAGKMASVVLQGPTQSAVICHDVATQVGNMLEMGPAVRQAIGECHEHWDGKGLPHRLKGEAISFAARVFILTYYFEYFERTRSADEALAVVRRRSGRHYDPRLAARFEEVARQLATRLHSVSVWDALLAAEPAPVRLLSSSELDRMAAMIGDFIDLRSSYTFRHSQSVASLAEAAGERQGLSDVERASLRLVGLLHDLGRAAVPVGLWEKKGVLSGADWERMKRHPSMTELILARSDALGHLATLAGLHHERLDGSGYRGVSAASLPQTARLLAAADAYQTRLETRPHRPAYAPEAAAAELLRQAEEGKLDAGAVAAVLDAAGHESAAAPSPGVNNRAGLSNREIEVLRLAIRGMSNKQMGEVLFVSPKTISHHIQHIYDKIGVSTRVGATLFALQHGLAQDSRGAGAEAQVAGAGH